MHTLILARRALAYKTGPEKQAMTTMADLADTLMLAHRALAYRTGPEKQAMRTMAELVEAHLDIGAQDLGLSRSERMVLWTLHQLEVAHRRQFQAHLLQRDIGAVDDLQSERQSSSVPCCSVTAVRLMTYN